jgi:hypothetical protein
MKGDYHGTSELTKQLLPSNDCVSTDITCGVASASTTKHYSVMYGLSDDDNDEGGGLKGFRK